ncbi:MAG: response regulator transcription factor [Pseudomonadota bacterium]
MSGASQILLVDDDHTLTQMLSELLQTEGYDCLMADNGATALELVSEHAPDLVVLDVMMPGDDGIATLRKLREVSDVAVIMLTAMGEADDRVLGLEAGADDYLAKPFATRELLLRIQALLRRLKQPQSDASPDVVRAGPVVLEPAKARASIDGTPLPLAGAELRVLELLASQPGEIVSREALTEFALGRKLSPYDRALDTHMSHLRSKLKKAGNTPVAILSVRGAGYRLVID